ncbi:UNKNOWN [Stylonychia lemnae]|uniref:Cysteine proteinase n=1 Tax=Stylonychia lemnae TaxID=5949 RepID=A0A078AC39_STYLE|nr:UNKNOWN [Stylonychia lemnae]|eukprot:CDW78348.1 UNKNOWN [Stylonychia lemnae]
MKYQSQLKKVGTIAALGAVAAFAVINLSENIYDSNQNHVFLQEHNDDQDVKKEFSKFLNNFNKNYITKEEYRARYEIYAANYALVNSHNNRNDSTFELELNLFADLSPEEFKSMQKLTVSKDIIHSNTQNENSDNGQGNEDGSRDHIPEPQQGANDVIIENEIRQDEEIDQVENEEQSNTQDDGNRRRLAVLPSAVDWRTSGFVSSIKNQGLCGSCYTFSSLAALESIYKIKKGGNLLDLSEQQLIDCTTVYGNFGCNGGNMNSNFQYLRYYKIQNETTYPYATRKNACVYQPKFGLFNVKTFVNVAFNDPAAHLAAVALQPLSIGLAASNSVFQLYKSGIIDSPTCGTSVDHAVLLIGYGKDLTGVSYWIIKNSWGVYWGERGYARIRRDTTKGPGMCGLLQMSSYPVLY